MKLSDYIINNPFRMLGICINSSVKDLNSNISKCKAFESVKKKSSFTMDLENILGSIDRTSADMDKAALEIATPEKKLAAGMFWFFENDFFKDNILKLISESKLDDAATALQNEIKKSKDIMSLQNLLIISVIRKDYQTATEIASNLYGSRCTEFQKSITPIFNYKKQYFITEYIKALNEEGVKIFDVVKNPKLLKWESWISINDDIDAIKNEKEKTEGTELPGNNVVTYDSSTVFGKFVTDLQFISTSEYIWRCHSKSALASYKKSFDIKIPSDEDIAKAVALLNDVITKTKSNKKAVASEITRNACLPIVLNIIELHIALAYDCARLNLEAINIKEKQDSGILSDNEELKTFITSDKGILKYRKIILFWKMVADFVLRNVKSASFDSETLDILNTIKVLASKFENRYMKFIYATEVMPKEILLETLVAMNMELVFVSAAYMDEINNNMQEEFGELLYRLNESLKKNEVYDDDQHIDIEFSKPSSVSSGNAKKCKRKKKAANGRNGAKKKKKR